MKVGILSDTHRRLDLAEDAIKFLVKEGVKALIHAGDIELPETLQMLEETSLPYTAVFGNNDRHLFHLQTRYNIHKEPYYFKIKDTTFKLMHLPFYLTPDSDIVIYGHLHRFEYQKTDSCLYLNPGEVCARKKPRSECAILDIDNRYEIIYCYKELPDNIWIKESIKTADPENL
ncbi:YfcE family phosphodiesterase [Nitrosophilus alvini]|uniref:YfcE family phosphodiesterase n=1 Tax=Nitrosophilus alvini TaxID=2714855 RepID=UPI00190CF0B3|nr:YfcE family phosphodiesterase [Nitrosophilus alvini]